MTADVPTAIRYLRNRLQNDNALTNLDSEYLSDLDEVLNLYVNIDTAQQGTIQSSSLAWAGPNLTAGTITMDPQGTIPVDPAFYSLWVVRTELSVIDRKIETTVPMAVSADTPAGKIRMKDVPQLWSSLRRDRLILVYDELLAIFIAGVHTGRALSLDMRDFLRFRQDIPIDPFSMF